MAQDPQTNIRLRLLKPTAGDRKKLQRILEGAADYHWLTTGTLPDEEAANSFLAACPRGKELSDKFVFGITLGRRLIGCVDVIRAFPADDTAVINDFILLPDYRRRGLGRRSYEKVEGIIRSWAGCSRIRIGVLGVNSQVLPFWESVGFRRTGERFPEKIGRITTDVIVLEKVIG